MLIESNLKTVLAKMEIETGQRPSYRDLAKAADCSVTTISDMANNKNDGLSRRILGRLCVALGAQPGDLLILTEGK